MQTAIQTDLFVASDSNYLRFLRFHEAHPRIYRLFERFTMEKITAGKKIGAKAVMERIRWEVDTGGKGDEEFKINNTYTTYYARMFAERHPGLNIFEFREKKK